MSKVISSASSNAINYNHVIHDSISAEKFSIHYHDRCEIIFCMGGDVSYIAEGRSYKLSRGDIVISRPTVIHTIIPAENTTYERYDVIINQKLLPTRIWDKLKRGRDVYHCLGNERIIDLTAKLDYYYKRFDDEDYARLVFNIVEEILYNLSELEGSNELAVSNPILDKALAYIRENLTTLTGVEEISKALYITKSHLHHLFSEHLQITPAKYITSKRLLLVQKRIRRGERPTAVFSECGFEDYATFYRNFKKHFGYSPAEEGKVEVKRQILS
ncbi:MAG: helix-turn-helix transcriptional regulator [Clostridia bacterium]|nr:helix-turn-helix transcriptional regulator [Clostridia bacterium]